MAEPVTGNEVKIRGFETPTLARLTPDHTVVIDGPQGGPGNANPSVIVSDGTRQLPVVNPTLTGYSDVRIPVVYKYNGLDQQGQAEVQALLSGTAGFYLGAHQFPPLTDSYGGQLQVGMTYYNINDEKIYVWSNQQRWVPGGSSYPAALKAFYYTFNVAGTMIPPNGPGSPDSYGNVLSFDVTAGQEAINAVNLYINGALLVNGVDYIIHEGGANGDYIDLAESYCANSVVVVQLFSTAETVFVPNAVKINTSTWVFNSINTTFPLVDMAGDVINPGSQNNILLVYNGSVIQPGIDFTLGDGTIIFPDAPGPGDYIWGTVGVPVGGGAVTTISPKNFGGVGDRVADDTLAVINCIQRMINSGAMLDLSGGSWRVTGPLPQFSQCNIQGFGTGEIYVDYDPAGAPILDCKILPRAEYTVTAIDVVDYDFNGEFTASSKLTRFAIAGSAALPPVGAVCKVTADDQIVGVEDGDSVGQHLYVVAVDTDARYVYSAEALVDSYTSDINLVWLGAGKVIMEAFRVSGNWERVVAEDWLFECVRVQGAIYPKYMNLEFRDAVQGLTDVGCYKPLSIGIRAHHMRNATASESPPIPGYGVVDGGCYMPLHVGIDCEDCRHGYTTISPDAVGWDRVAWGRTIEPVILAGRGSGCSAAAFDAHSDAWQPIFQSCIVTGGYYGENSAGAGLQMRGVRGRMIDCEVRGSPVGFEFYKQFVGEATGHSIEGCRYFGTGIPLRVERDVGLAAGDARSTIYCGDFNGETSHQIGMDLTDADLIVTGNARIVQKGAPDSPRAIYLRQAATVRSLGGLLTHDITQAVGAPTPRVLTVNDIDCKAPELAVRVIAGTTAWQAVVSENEATALALPAGAFVVDCEADKEPVAASGGYSQTGSSNLLPAGAAVLRLSINGARSAAARTANFTLNASMRGQSILCTAALTATVPSVAVLGSEFRCEIIADGGTVTVDGPGGTNGSIPSGSIGRVRVVNGKSWVDVATMTLLT